MWSLPSPLRCVEPKMEFTKKTTGQVIMIYEATQDASKSKDAAKIGPHKGSKSLYLLGMGMPDHSKVS